MNQLESDDQRPYDSWKTIQEFPFLAQNKISSRKADELNNSKTTVLQSLYIKHFYRAILWRSELFVNFLKPQFRYSSQLLDIVLHTSTFR